MKKLQTYIYDELPEMSFDGKYRKLDVSLIKYITGRVRHTIEYRNFVDYMKKTININRCTFYKNYSMENGFTIELHHSPFCLYDYVETVCNKHYSKCDKDPYIEPWRVEEEVNKLHYQFLVGLVPLNPTSHKLVHSGNLKIHPRMVEGNWSKFVESYKEYLSDEVRGKLEEFKTIGKSDPDEIPEIMKYKPIMISNLKFRSLGNYDMEKIIIKNLQEKFENRQIEQSRT
ncbi:MAG: hypothetical protein ACOCZ5_02845 [bacterium]